MAENYELSYVLIGKRIKELRQRKKISQIELAEMADVSETYISYIESAKKKASLSVLVSIANALNVSMDELLAGNQDTKRLEYQTEIDEIMAGCNRYEKRVLFEMVLSLRASLKENRALLDKKQR